jgi:hypothetical protein
MLEAIDHDHFFVDEAGDSALFDKRGRVIVGTKGVSQFFMLGVVHLPDPARVRRELDALRANLLCDPYFAGVPSMDPSQRKTALFFHAKDDVPEVRREVLRTLSGFNAKVRVAIKRKSALVAEAAELFKRGHKLPATVVYDQLVQWLFRGLLNPDRHSLIAFAKRGKSDRLTALSRAIEHSSQSVMNIYADQPLQSAGLQAADYYLWVVQRLFERREDRFFNLLAKDFDVIMELDDRRNNQTGEWYDRGNPIDLQKIMPETS